MAKTALCIGINNYPGTHMDLSGCINDAEDWSAELQSRGFTVSRLIDAKATKAAMLKGFKSIVGGAKKGDSVVITFSGHGTYVPDVNGDELDGLDEALCPYDLQINGAALLDDEIHAIFASRAPGVRLVLISDSCHSGTVTRAAAADPDADAAPRERRHFRRPCHAARAICSCRVARKGPTISATTPVSMAAPTALFRITR
jgi:uncharacterized caspase-like protein